MIKPTISIFLYRTQPKKDGTCAVAIRVTHQRTRRFYPTGILLRPEDFDALMNSKRRNDHQKGIFNRIRAFENRANQVAAEMNVFTFIRFEDAYLSNREAADTILGGFQRYIEQLKEQGRISTAITYECAINSIEDFRKGLRFADVTPVLLDRYEKWMLEKGKSKTTVGFYLRSLRSIMNQAKIDPSLYPFGKERGKYLIPSGRNIKKALRTEEIERIYRYPTTTGTVEDMAKDFWFFMYLCNGMNVKDVCLLKWKHKEGDQLRFTRAKTTNTKRDQVDVVVHLKPISKAIISKYGQPSIDPDAFIFSILHKESTPEDIRRGVQQLTQNINKHIGRIAQSVGLDKKVTTYSARHSFATVLRNSGASVEMISQLLNHSDVKTTASYLDGFERESIERATDALTNFL